MISVNECDPLRDEGINFYRFLMQNSVHARCRQVMGTVHGTEIFISCCPDISRSTASDIANRRGADGVSVWRKLRPGSTYRRPAAGRMKAQACIAYRHSKSLPQARQPNARRVPLQAALWILRHDTGASTSCHGDASAPSSPRTTRSVSIRCCSSAAISTLSSSWTSWVTTNSGAASITPAVGK